MGYRLRDSATAPACSCWFRSCSMSHKSSAPSGRLLFSLSARPPGSVGKTVQHSLPGTPARLLPCTQHLAASPARLMALSSFWSCWSWRGVKSRCKDPSCPDTSNWGPSGQPWSLYMPSYATQPKWQPTCLHSVDTGCTTKLATKQLNGLGQLDSESVFPVAKKIVISTVKTRNYSVAQAGVELKATFH